MTRPEKKDGYEIRSALRLVGLVGGLMSASILTGTWAGIKLDAALALQGPATVAGALAGVALGLAGSAWLLLQASPKNTPPERK
jgi:hypothetical protein